LIEQQDLIFDIGVHKGEDADYYLNRGFRVVGIEPNPEMIKVARAKFAKEITDKRLVLLNYAVSDKDHEEVDFYVSTNSAASSLDRKLSDRGKWHHKETVRVQTRKLSTIIKEHGVPYYCKIDVEGSETVCLETLEELPALPSFISVQAESTTDNTEEEALRTINHLYKLEYRKFKLVDQYTLTVLEAGVPFYVGVSRVSPAPVNSRLWFWKNWLVRGISHRFAAGFPVGASGTIGDDLDSEWMTYEIAKETYLQHRLEYSKVTPKNMGLWCDWHAKLD
jgi:FkbM family methyltransferase